MVDPTPTLAAESAAALLTVTVVAASLAMAVVTSSSQEEKGEALSPRSQGMGRLVTAAMAASRPLPS
jgi:hypothetical protein